jgi:murein DD-endopeptidase MepM/ murein hydrolase activator NlpD
MIPPFAQAPGGARRAATFSRARGLLSVAALIPLAPTFQAAGQIAEHVSERAAARPTAVFPMGAKPDWGEADARFGAYRGGHMHEGQDVFAPAGTPLLAIRDGRVVEKGDDGGRGNYVAIWSSEAGHTFVYLHMQRPTPFAPGDEVEVGERVGAVGCTGSCWGDHLHFEVRNGRGTTGGPRDPLPLLQRLAARR